VEFLSIFECQAPPIENFLTTVLKPTPTRNHLATLKTHHNNLVVDTAVSCLPSFKRTAA